MPPPESAAQVGRAFATSAHQRAMMRALLGPTAFPTAEEVAADDGWGGGVPEVYPRPGASAAPAGGSTDLMLGAVRGHTFLRAVPLMTLGSGRGRRGETSAAQGMAEGAATAPEPGGTAALWSAPPDPKACDKASIAAELCEIMSHAEASAAVTATASTAASTASSTVASTAVSTLAGPIHPPPPTAPPFAPPMPHAWPRNELLVCMLGTGCAVPSKHRAPAAVYLHAYARGGILLDAGEGTLGQMCALMGPSKAAAALARLSLVWISHHHADHHLGLLRLLAAASSLRPPSAPPLLVVGPRAVGTFLAAYQALSSSALPPSGFDTTTDTSCLHPPGGGGPAFASAVAAQGVAAGGGATVSMEPSAGAPLRFRFESCASLNAPRSAARDWLLRRSGLGLRHIQCVPVVHCADAWGVVLAHANGWSVAYSGDTRPCEALVAAGRGVTLLIHEATFDDTRGADAIQKRHSTRGEALAVARRMGAHRTILTHLSQRYRELHETPEAAPEVGPEAAPEVAPEAATTGSGGAHGSHGDVGSTGGGGGGPLRGAPPHAPALEADSSGASLVAFDLMAINLADLAAVPAHTKLLEGYFAADLRRQRALREAEAVEQRERSERLEREAGTALRERRGGAVVVAQPPRSAASSPTGAVPSSMAGQE